MNNYNIDDFLHNAGNPDFHSVQTIELGELIHDNVFTWERVNWRNAAYDEEQYNRLCKAFEMRFWVREISITPVGLWMQRLQYELIYELMPKYKPLYAELENGFDPLQAGGEYRKERRIDSDFPETLLSNNQDYASSGYDYERESVIRGNIVDDYYNYAEKFKAIDAMILDELDAKMFSSLYSTNVNAW